MAAFIFSNTPPLVTLELPFLREDMRGEFAFEVGPPETGLHVSSMFRQAQYNVTLSIDLVTPENSHSFCYVHVRQH
jgi:hypothetical protein